LDVFLLFSFSSYSFVCFSGVFVIICSTIETTIEFIYSRIGTLVSLESKGVTHGYIVITFTGFRRINLMNGHNASREFIYTYSHERDIPLMNRYILIHTRETFCSWMDTYFVYAREKFCSWMDTYLFTRERLSVHEWIHTLFTRERHSVHKRICTLFTRERPGI